MKLDYINILSMILDSDKHTTREFASLDNSVPTQFFVDTDDLTDKPTTFKIDDERFISLRMIDHDIVRLEYYLNCKGSAITCSKMIRIEFFKDIEDLIPVLAPTKKSVDGVFCAFVHMFDFPNSLSCSPSRKNEKYYTKYSIHKNDKNHYFLQSEMNFYDKVINNYVINSFSRFYDISPQYQSMLAECIAEDEIDEDNLSDFDYSCLNDFDDDFGPIDETDDEYYGL